MDDDALTGSRSISINTQLFKALGDETRVKIVGLLAHGELCVCDLMAVLDLPQSTASRHLAYLKNSSWIIGRRSGRWMYYRLNPEVLSRASYRSIIDLIRGLDEIKSDLAVLREYLNSKQASRCL